MVNDDARRQRVLGLLRRQRTWEIESRRVDLAKARERLAPIERSYAALLVEAATVEAALRQLYAGETGMDVVAVQRASRFLEDVEDRRERCLSARLVAEDRVRTLERHLRAELLFVERLEVRERAAGRRVIASSEERHSRQVGDIWLQRQWKGSSL